MSLIGDLIIDISVKTDGLKKSFDKTRKSRSGFVSGLSSMKGTLLGVGNFFAGGEIVAVASNQLFLNNLEQLTRQQSSLEKWGSLLMNSKGLN